MLSLTEVPKIIGIQPRLLLSQVQNTAPFIFDSEFPPHKIQSPTEIAYIQELRKSLFTAGYVDEIFRNKSLYFKYCLSAHFATVATFVPTDVDNTIRFKLWSYGDPVFEMAETVIQSRFWNTNIVSTRWVKSPVSGNVLGGHLGEWFSVAVAAYAANYKINPEIAQELQHLIRKEQDQHAQIFADFIQAKDGIGTLKTSALIAHNLGDMERVMEMWNFPEPETLRTQNKNSLELLERAGNLNRETMAVENHRHLPLRIPRCLRRSVDLLLPIGPFFDSWGQTVAQHPALSSEEVGKIAEALVDGWEKLNRKNSKTPTKGPIGYARALAGILETFPGGLQELSHYLPSKISRTLKAGELRSLCSIPQSRFQEQWNRMGLTRC